jgi:hypothetical protein
MLEADSSFRALAEESPYLYHDIVIDSRYSYNLLLSMILLQSGEKSSLYSGKIN